MPVLDLSAYKPVPATLGDANQIANGMQAIQNAINGIDNLNFAAGLIFDPAKIMQAAAIDGDPLVWDNTLTKWKPASAMAAGRPRAPRVVVSTMAGGPPASPVDQDIWIATAVDANATRWAFQYNAGSASASKWEFIGGPDVLVADDGTVTTASATYAVPTAGTGAQISITVARAGDYLVGHSGFMSANAAVNCDVGLRASGAADVNLARNGTGIANGNTPYGASKRMNGVTAGGTIQPIVEVGGGTGTYAWRVLAVRPVRIA